MVDSMAEEWSHTVSHRSPVLAWEVFCVDFWVCRFDWIVIPRSHFLLGRFGNKCEECRYIRSGSVILTVPRHTHIWLSFSQQVRRQSFCVFVKFTKDRAFRGIFVFIAFYKQKDYMNTFLNHCFHGKPRFNRRNSLLLEQTPFKAFPSCVCLAYPLNPSI